MTKARKKANPTQAKGGEAPRPPTETILDLDKWVGWHEFKKALKEKVEEAK